MSDEVENPTAPVAPEVSETQPEQAAVADEAANAPAVPAEKEELILGKFKTQEDLGKSYQELEQKSTRTAQENAELKQMLAQMSPQAPTQATAPEQAFFDADTAANIQAIADARYEARKAQEFTQKHADELKDPLLASRTAAIIRENNAAGQMVDQEAALAQAKKELDERIKPQLKDAQAQGVEQGEDLAKKKGQLGAVGESGPRPDVDMETLSAEDYAKTLKIPRGR